jgi:hypothetical protein
VAGGATASALASHHFMSCASSRDCVSMNPYGFFYLFVFFLSLPAPHPLYGLQTLSPGNTGLTPLSFGSTYQRGPHPCQPPSACVEVALTCAREAGWPPPTFPQPCSQAVFLSLLFPLGYTKSAPKLLASKFFKKESLQMLAWCLDVFRMVLKPLL